MKREHDEALPLVIRHAQEQRSAAAPRAGGTPPGRQPSRLSKRTLLLSALGALLALGLLYPVENVVTASGQVIPSDRVQTVQHLEGGIVTAVHVREGQTVIKGQALLEIDLGGSSLNLEQLTARQATAQAIKTRLTAESLGRQLKAGDFPAKLDRAIVQAELGAFAARALEQQGSLASAQASACSITREGICWRANASAAASPPMPPPAISKGVSICRL